MIQWGWYRGWKYSDKIRLSLQYWIIILKDIKIYTQQLIKKLKPIDSLFWWQWRSWWSWWSWWWWTWWLEQLRCWQNKSIICAACSNYIVNKISHYYLCSWSSTCLTWMRRTRTSRYVTRTVSRPGPCSTPTSRGLTYPRTH